ncbi:hypothetical protein V5799_014777 [Amblyomma americanum]|uniref:Uncharacterized protein n=1 Tax=Amblyomma americanum TaxID=6943 RepID=A0AAQ4E216_AMBAM
MGRKDDASAGVRAQATFAPSCATGVIMYLKLKIGGHLLFKSKDICGCVKTCAHDDLLRSSPAHLSSRQSFSGQRARDKQPAEGGQSATGRHAPAAAHGTTRIGSSRPFIAVEEVAGRGGGRAA